MAKTEQFLVIEQDQEIVRFNERLRQLRALSPEQRIKYLAARAHELRVGRADNYTHMLQQEDESCSVGESLRLRTAQSDEGQKVSTMKLGYHHRRLLQHLLDHPDSAHGLHTQQIKRKAESLIKMGFIDESWRVTEAGKSTLANEEARQQQQQ